MGTAVLDLKYAGKVNKDPTNQLSDDPASVLGAGIDSLGQAIGNIGQLPTDLIQAVMDILSGNPGAVLSDVQNFVDDIPLIGPFVEAIVGQLGDLTDLSDFFGNLEGMLGLPNLSGGGSFNPIEAVENFVTTMISPTGLLAGLADGFLSIFNIPGLDASKITSGTFPNSMIPGLVQLEQVVDGLLDAIPGGELLQPLIDMIFNSLTNSNATDVPLGLVGQEIRALQNVAATAGNLATQAFEVTQAFGGLLHQLIEDLPIAPIYQGFEDFLANMFNVLGTTVGNIFQALSPSNPGTAVNSNQIAALWAHVSAASTAGIHYSFSSSVSLTANYAGTSNPAWSPAGPLTMPSVYPSSNYVYSTLNTQGMVFTGNPNNAVTGDHGLVTDKNQAYTTVASLAFGTDVIFISGHYTGGILGQNVEVELGYGGPSALALYTCTGPNSGRTRQTLTMADGVTTQIQYDIPSPGVRLNDVWGVQFDGIRTYTIYYNNMAVATWQDSATTPILTHGPGYRECGMIPTNTGGSFIGMSEFTALDYV